MRDISFHADFDADMARLMRFDPGRAEIVYDLVYDYLAVYGVVPESCSPHVLSHRRGCMTGYMECHACDDVLVVYKVTPRHVLLRRICTHAELESCRFGREWPRD